jgi:dihydropyrimidinase
VVFDSKKEFTITSKKLHMNVDYTPYEGMKVTGMPVLVYSKGKKVSHWDKDRMKFVGTPGKGKFVKREPFQPF